MVTNVTYYYYGNDAIKNGLIVASILPKANRIGLLTILGYKRYFYTKS